MTLLAEQNQLISLASQSWEGYVLDDQLQIHSKWCFALRRMITYIFHGEFLYASDPFSSYRWVNVINKIESLIHENALFLTAPENREVREGLLHNLQRVCDHLPMNHPALRKTSFAIQELSPSSTSTYASTASSGSLPASPNVSEILGAETRLESLSNKIFSLGGIQTPNDDLRVCPSDVETLSIAAKKIFQKIEVLAKEEAFSSSLAGYSKKQLFGIAILLTFQFFVDFPYIRYCPPKILDELYKEFQDRDNPNLGGFRGHITPFFSRILEIPIQTLANIQVDLAFHPGFTPRNFE